MLVVACSCSLALATPIAMLASIGAAAKRGLLIKGGKYLERLARADVLLIDKTGTLTLGRPQITDVVPLNGLCSATNARPDGLGRARLGAPAGRGVRRAPGSRPAPRQPSEFEALPGHGVRARRRGRRDRGRQPTPGSVIRPAAVERHAASSSRHGQDTALRGLGWRTDRRYRSRRHLRHEVPAALAQVRAWASAASSC